MHANTAVKLLLSDVSMQSSQIKTETRKTCIMLHVQHYIYAVTYAKNRAKLIISRSLSQNNVCEYAQRGSVNVYQAVRKKLRKASRNAVFFFCIEITK